MKKQIQTIKTYLEFFLKNTKWKFPLFIFISFFSGLFEGIGFSLFIPLLSKTNISNSQGGGEIKEIIIKTFKFFNITYSITNILILILIIFSLSSIFKGVQNVARVYITSSIKRLWKNKIAILLERLDYTKFISFSSGYLSNMIIKEVDRAIGSFSQICMLIISVLNIIVYLAFSFILSWIISLFSGVIGLILMISIKNLFLISKKISAYMTKLNTLLQEDLIQILHSYKYLKATSSYNKLYLKIKKTITQLLMVEIKQCTIEWIIRIFLDITAITVVVAVIYYQVVVKSQNMSSILILALFFHKTMRQINILPNAWNSFLVNSGGLNIVNKMFNMLENNHEINGTTILDKFKDKIEFKNVDFCYGDKEILKNINIQIKKNKTIAFVGESGAGKSTIIDLITGILKPAKGDILIDNFIIDKINLIEFRKKIGYVTQEIVVYNDNIANNVTLWEKDNYIEEDKQKINNALEKAKCNDFVNTSHRDIFTSLGDRGVTLSVGQKQRIAIARELYKNAEILIFDEATSSLDTKSEKFIQQSINELKNKVTIILIAHRLSTIKNSDYIYVVKCGKIVEFGTYNKLYDNINSQFRKMCEMQSFA